MQHKRLVVTGGHGFLGQHVVRHLREKGYEKVLTFDRADYDLTEQHAVRRMFKDLKPQVLVHLAAYVGGIGANRQEPGRFFYDNIIMGAMLMEEARQWGVEKLLVVSTVCSYPERPPLPFREESLWDGFPEASNAPYGVAKRVLMVQGTAYRQQYGLPVIFAIPTNLYGPGDTFDPARSHVIPALIKKFIEAVNDEQRSVTIWGTGQATREFLYVEDCAAVLVKLLERYDSPEPVNIGSGCEVSIAELAHLVAHLTGFTGAIQWDATKPEGQQRRRLDRTRLERSVGHVPTIPFREGLQRTIDWYRERVRNQFVNAR